ARVPRAPARRTASGPQPTSAARPRTTATRENIAQETARIALVTSAQEALDLQSTAAPPTPPLSPDPAVRNLSPSNPCSGPQTGRPGQSAGPFFYAAVPDAFISRRIRGAGALGRRRPARAQESSEMIYSCRPDEQKRKVT